MIPELEEIKRLLYFDWDTIGVSDIPEAFDEYDSYALQVFVMLNDGADTLAIAHYLDWVVTDQMELPVPGNSSEIAARIKLLPVGHTRI